MMASPRPTKRARKDTPQRSPDEVVDIDPEGDLVLRVGPDPGVLIKVSSKHLTLVSKVFKTLLGPKFSEGQSLHDVSDPLLLPDDNAEAMILMCRLAHHTVTRVDDIKPKEVQGLIVVCDKYDCAPSFQFYLHTIIEKWLADHEGSETGLSGQNTTTTFAGLHILDALCIAYLAQDAECFKSISQYVFGKATINMIEGKMSKAMLAVMPDGFASGLSKALQKAIEDATAQLRNPLDACARHVASSSSNPSAACKAMQRRVGNFALLLSHHGLLSTYQVRKHDNIMTRLSGHSYCLRDGALKVPVCSDNCKYCRFDFVGATAESVDEATKQLGYLCLFCVREGSYRRTRSGCMKHKSN